MNVLKYLKLILAAFPLFTAIILSGCGGSGDGNKPLTTFLPTPHSISGSVSGYVTSGVTVELSGLVIATTTTDASGNYSFTGLYDGSYTVTPSKLGSTFAPTSTAVTLGGANVAGTNFVASQAFGDLSGIVKDAVSGAVLSGVTVNFYSGSSLVASITTNGSGIYTATSLPIGVLYSATVTKTGYITANISNIMATQESAVTTLETVQLVQTIYAGVGTISGAVKNAFTGLGLTGVTLNFRSGINVTTGTIVATTTSSTEGAYTDATLAGGNYTGEAILSGYVSGYFTITVIGGQTTSNQDATITPTLPVGQTRIVLTWGASPSDLDSHLTGPVSGSSTRFHVLYSSKGSSTASPFAALDVDDTSSYGPETTTIYTQTTGTYRFSVHDFTNEASSSSTALSSSGALVKVFTSNGLVATFNVPGSQGGTLWTVFEMSGSVIIPKNTMTYASDSATIP